MQEEPGYRTFKYVCGKCGERFLQASSIRLHPDQQDCPFCTKIEVTGTKVWPARGEVDD